MKKLPWIAHAAINAVGTFIYVCGVAWFMIRAQDIFGGGMNAFWGPIAMLLLLVLSAAIVGLLVFGRPAYLLIKGRTDEAVKTVIGTVAILFLLMLIVMGVISMLPATPPRNVIY